MLVARKQLAAGMLRLGQCRGRLKIVCKRNNREQQRQQYDQGHSLQRTVTRRKMPSCREIPTGQRANRQRDPAQIEQEFHLARW